MLDHARMGDVGRIRLVERSQTEAKTHSPKSDMLRELNVYGEGRGKKPLGRHQQTVSG